MILSTKTKAEFGLLLAVILWALTFPFVRIVLQEISPLHIIFIRGLIATLVFLPFIFFIKSNSAAVLKLLPTGFLVGLFYFLAYYTQTIGLKTISSGRSAFITNLTIIFVPFLSPFFKRGFPSQKDLISSFIAMCGIYFLTDPLSQTGINIGDFYTVLTALCFSLQIQILHSALDKNSFPTIYAFWQVFFIFGFSSCLLPFSQSEMPFFPTSTIAILALAYLALVAMVFTTWLQTRFQNQTTPERAVIIYIIEPVFACIFGYILLNEKMTLLNLFGGFLIIMAVLWNSIFKFFMKRLKNA